MKTHAITLSPCLLSPATFAADMSPPSAPAGHAPPVVASYLGTGKPTATDAAELTEPKDIHDLFARVVQIQARQLAEQSKEYLLHTQHYPAQQQTEAGARHIEEQKNGSPQ